MNKQNAAQKLAADLAVLAKAATPGPWVTDGDFVNEHGNVLRSYIANGRRAGGRIAEAFANCLVKTDEQCQANAAFIAGANPKAVLVLTAEIERLAADLLTADGACFLSIAENKKLKHELDTLTASAEAIRDQWRADQAECEALRKRLRLAINERDAAYLIFDRSTEPSSAYVPRIESHVDAENRMLREENAALRKEASRG